MRFLNCRQRLLGFPKKMDGEKQTRRSTADDGDAIAVQETRWSGWIFHFAFPCMREDTARVPARNLFLHSLQEQKSGSEPALMNSASRC